MTQPIAPNTAAAAAATGPAPHTLVLANRQLRPDAQPSLLSVFADDRWDLTAGVFEDHVLGVSVSFEFAPPRWRQDMKRYFWLLVNDPQPPGVRRAPTGRLALRSIPLLAPKLGRLLAWCDARGIDRFGQLDTAALDLLLAHVRDLEASAGVKAGILTELHRLWVFRHLLPPRLRLPEPLPWGGEDTRDLLGAQPTQLVNRTPRIGQPVLGPLLTWAIRFVTDLTGDITTAYHQWVALSTNQPQVHNRPSAIERRLVEVCTLLAEHGLGIPGHQQPDGTRQVHFTHLARLVGCHTDLLRRRRQLIAEAGLPVDDGAYLPCPVTACIGGLPWRSRPITFAEAPTLARHLSTACFIVIAYLSGMRPGEVLSIERGAARRDPVTGLWLLDGRHWKGVTGADGAKLVAGEQRTDPWVVHEVTTQAVAILERLHDQPQPFPDTLFVAERQRHLNRRAGRTRTDKSINRDIGLFITWVNQYCQDNERADTIPPDPAGPVTTSRFRRSLAWNIVRQPRGLVAAAIQYGHIRVRVTQGYAGSAESGFLDDLCFEDWLLRLEQFADAHHRLGDGEHVSGPAADGYRRRVGEAHARFAGRTVHTTRQARNLLADPTLQVFPGDGMHCVFIQTTALCQLRDGNDHRLTPDVTDCRPRCPNIARTDADVAILRADLRRLEQACDDPLAPAPRRARDQARAERLRAVIARHDQHQPEAESP
jgi:integrase